MLFRSGTSYQLAEDQSLELAGPYTGPVYIKALLSGTATASPILAPEILVISGTIADTGFYTGKVFAMGSSTSIGLAFSAWLPNGSTVEVSVDDGAGTFTNMTLVSSVQIDEGFVEQNWTISGHNAPNGGRPRLKLTGSASARPAIADLRAYSY